MESLPLWGIRAIIRHLGRVDEMQRGAHLTGMSVGFGVAITMALSIGALTSAGLNTAGWGSWVIALSGMLSWSWASSRRGATI